MNIVLIIGSIVAAIVFFIFAGVRSSTSREDDPLYFLFIILTIGMFFAGLHFFSLLGKTFNYTDGFSLQLPEDWEASQSTADFSDLGENVSVYANPNSSFVIGVTRIDKADTDRFKKNVKDAEKQRAAEIKNIEDKELRAIAKKEKYNVHKIHGIKWLAETDVQLKTVFNKRMYVIVGNGDYITVAGTLNIKPFGFFSGMGDGYLIPIQSINALFNKSIHPYKTTNNGFLYLLGFVLGAGVLAGLLIWLIGAIVQYREWNAMTVQEKISTITSIYQGQQEQNKENLQEAEKDYRERVKAYEGQTPETALKTFKEIPVPEVGFFSNIFTAGKAGLKAVQDHYKTAVAVYEYYKSRYTVSNARVKMIDDEYNYLCKKGNLCVQEIKKIKKEFIKKFGFDALKVSSASGPDNLEIEKFDYNDIQKAMKSMEQLFDKYNIKTEKRWKTTFNFVFDGFLNENKSLEDSLIDSGLALAASAIGQYFDNLEKATVAKKKLVEDEHRIVVAISAIEKNQNRIDAFAAREENLRAIISKVLEWYMQKFDAVYAMMYLDGDASKTPEARKKREAQGGEYYTFEEKKEVALLIFLAQKTFKFLNANI